MTSKNEGTVHSDFPTPCDIILSNLANQLLCDENFYVDVLNLAKQYGYSAVYQRKVIVHPKFLDYANNPASLDNLEALGGCFQWVPFDLLHKDEPGIQSASTKLRSGKVISPNGSKCFWSARRKDACDRTSILATSIKCKSKQILKGGRKSIDIKIKTSKVGECYNQPPNAIKDVRRNHCFNKINIKDKGVSSEWCKIKTNDYDLFPIFKNYKEGKPGNKLYVKNLSKSVTLQDLENLFASFVKSAENDVNNGFHIRFFERGKLRRQVSKYPFADFYAC